MTNDVLVYWRVIVIIALITIACSNVRIELQPPTPAAIAMPALIPTPRPQPTPFPTFTPRPPPPIPELSCLIPDLALGQHLSSGGSYTESQWSASGLMTCRIERDTCAYDLMVGLLDPTIIYKQEEEFPFSTEDILMHPAVVQPLSRLSQLVLAEWDGQIALRVTDAYDSLLEHDLNQTDLTRKYSLHFEGRAVDLTLWPVDQSRYGRLCALALCAGFDWVDNEGTHCHASLRTESLCTQCGQ